MKLLARGRCVLLCAWIALSACGGAAAPNAPTPLSSSGALPDSAYRVEWVDSWIPSTWDAGETAPVSVTIRNTGDALWPSASVHGPSASNVYVSYHWLPAEGNEMLVLDGIWSWLPKDVAPGESFTLEEMPVKALDIPGAYRLQFSLVHDKVTWFEQKGANTLTVPVTIE